MKKTLLTLAILFFYSFGYAQWEICYSPGYINVNYIYHNLTTGCWELCPSVGSVPTTPALCYTAIPNPVPAELPNICHEEMFENTTASTIKVFWEYQLACGNYGLPAWPHWSDQMNCFNLTCSGYVLNQTCFATSVSDYILAPMSTPRKLVSYELKDQCAGQGDNPGTISSSCECPTLGLEVDGTYYSLSGLLWSGSNITPIPVVGGSLTITFGPGTVTFGTI